MYNNKTGKVELMPKEYQELTDHTKPSKTTLTMFEKMTEKIDNLKEDINGIKIAIAELPQKLLDKADNRYADKKMEKVINRILVGIVILFFSIVGQLLFFLLNKI